MPVLILQKYVKKYDKSIQNTKCPFIFPEGRIKKYNKSMIYGKTVTWLNRVERFCGFGYNIVGM